MDSKTTQIDNLFQAIEAGDVASVSEMIRSGVNLNANNDQGYTPLSFAISNYFHGLKIGKYDSGVLPFSHENQNLNEIIVLIQKHLQTPDVSQFLVAQKFMRFLSIIYKDNPPQFEEDTLKYLAGLDSGACNGFSAILGDLASQGKVSQFLDDLKLIANWDGESDSLKASNTLFNTIRTMYDNSVFISYIQSKTILKNFSHDQDSSPLPKKDGRAVQQKDWDALTRLISDRPVERTKEFEAVFSYRSNELADAINNIALEGKSVRFSFKHHTMALFKENGKFMFYDPNSPDLPHFVDTAEEVVKQIETAYTRFEKNKELKPDSLMEIEMQVFNFNNSPPGVYPDLNKLISDYLSKRENSSSINELNFSKIAKTNALGTAIFLDSPKSVEALLLAGADPNLAVLSLANLFDTKPNQIEIFSNLVDKGLNPSLPVPNWDGTLKPFYECVENACPHITRMLKNFSRGFEDPDDPLLKLESTLYQGDSELFSETLNQSLKSTTVHSSDLKKIQDKLNVIIDIHQNQFKPSAAILSEYKKMNDLLENAEKLLSKKSNVSNPKVYMPLAEKSTTQEKIPTVQASETLLENKIEDETKKTKKPESN